VVLAQDGCLDAADLPLLFADTFLKVSKLVLERLDDLFSDLLLFFELLCAADCFLAPVLVLLAHAVDIVSYEVD